MGKNYLKCLLSLLLLFAGLNVWGDEITFKYSDYLDHGQISSGSNYTMEKDYVTIADSKFYCGENAIYAQFYPNGTTTITPGTGITIINIVLTTTDKNYNGYQDSGTVTASTGTVTGSTSSTTVTWKGSATEAFTISHSKQIRWTSIVVTYVSSSTPKHNLSWSVNGMTTTTEVFEGTDIIFKDPSETNISGKKFIGWTTASISEMQTNAPTFVTSATMGTEDITYYAVYATETVEPTTWNQVTTLAGIVEGTYVIKNDAYILPNTKTTSASPSAVNAPTIENSKITDTVDSSMEWIFTSTGTETQFFVQNSSGNYLYETNSNNGLRVGTTDDKWTFAINTAGYFSMKGANNGRYCAKYSDGSDWRSYTSPTASNYSNSGKIELYRKVVKKNYSDYCTTVPSQALTSLEISDAGYSTYYNSMYPYTMPEGLTGYIFDSTSNKIVSTYVAGAVVPADEALVLKGNAGTYTLTSATATNEKSNNNALQGTDEATTIADDANYNFYILSLDASSTAGSVGFYYKENNGRGGFINGAHKAYLKLTKESGAKVSYPFNIDYTGINAVENSEVSTGIVYNIAGQRVNTNAKGIVIVNGKKYTNK